MNSNEFEIVEYPKVNHVHINMVNLRYRNRHVHRAIEFVLVLSGSGTIYIGGNTFALKPGSLFYINFNEPHEFSSNDASGMNIIYLQVSNNFCQEYLPFFRNLFLPVNDLSAALSEEQGIYLTDLFLKLVTTSFTDTPTHNLDCLYYFTAMLHSLLSYVPYEIQDDSTYRSKIKVNARLSRITEYIDENFDHKLTLSELAERENISVCHLSHFFSKNLSLSFQEYLNNVRFENALKLIENSNMNLVDISMSCGFSDVKYLNGAFYKKFGCTVPEYRKCRPEQVKKEIQIQTQSFVSEEIGLQWIEDFLAQHGSNINKIS